MEFFTLSKSYNMPGWRIGFCCGNTELISALARLKSYFDYGHFTPIQVAGIEALNNGDEYIRVSGIVRPRDISSDNIVPSDRIANADIDYIGAGDTAVSGKKGWYSKFLETVSPI